MKIAHLIKEIRNCEKCGFYMIFHKKEKELYCPRCKSAIRYCEYCFKKARGVMYMDMGKFICSECDKRIRNKEV